jgi:hypothetical protein
MADTAGIALMGSAVLRILVPLSRKIHTRMVKVPMQRMMKM